MCPVCDGETMPSFDWCNQKMCHPWARSDNIVTERMDERKQINQLNTERNNNLSFKQNEENFLEKTTKQKTISHKK